MRVCFDADRMYELLINGIKTDNSFNRLVDAIRDVENKGESWKANTTKSDVSELRRMYSFSQARLCYPFDNFDGTVVRVGSDYALAVHLGRRNTLTRKTDVSEILRSLVRKTDEDFILLDDESGYFVDKKTRQAIGSVVFNDNQYEVYVGSNGSVRRSLDDPEDFLTSVGSLENVVNGIIAAEEKITGRKVKDFIITPTISFKNSDS